MEDYILREIDKIGKVIQAILEKARLVKAARDVSVYQMTKTELLAKLDLDVDALLNREGFIDVLIQEYGFSHENLDKFAELLFDLTVASSDKTGNTVLIAAIGSIYTYLDKHERSFSFNRFYILKELEKF